MQWAVSGLPLLEEDFSFHQIDGVGVIQNPAKLVGVQLGEQRAALMAAHCCARKIVIADLNDYKLDLVKKIVPKIIPLNVNDGPICIKN